MVCGVITHLIKAYLAYYMTDCDENKPCFSLFFRKEESVTKAPGSNICPCTFFWQHKHVISTNKRKTYNTENSPIYGICR